MLRRIMLVAGLAIVLAPASAQAAKPKVTTGRAVSVTPTTATLIGSVDANRRNTTYYFDVGFTNGYGSNTVVTSVGARARSMTRSPTASEPTRSAILS